jgi:hypothetical protein
MIERARKRLSKRAKKGFRGWPLATVALYGPDDSAATKLTVGIVPAEDAEATDLRRWFSKEQTDIRDDIRVTEEVLAFVAEAGAKSIVMTAPAAAGRTCAARRLKGRPGRWPAWRRMSGVSGTRSDPPRCFQIGTGAPCNQRDSCARPKLSDGAGSAGTVENCVTGRRRHFGLSRRGRRYLPLAIKS